MVGSAATETTWPVVAAWARWRDGDGELPESVRSMPEEALQEAGGGLGERIGYGVELIAGLGARTAARSGRGDGAVGANHPRGRAGRRRPSSRGSGGCSGWSRARRISLGLLLDERAERAPEEVCFLFEDRGHSNAAVKHRIDSVVRGLISLGIREGEHVGVLMGTRPSALAVVAALNRLGAVVVLLRPGGDVAREAELGRA